MQFAVGSGQVIVHDEEVVRAGLLRVRKLVLRLFQPLLDALLRFGASSAETLLELVFGGGSNEDISCRELGILDLLYALGFDIQ